LFGIAILSAPPGGSNVTRTVCTDLTKACPARDRHSPSLPPVGPTTPATTSRVLSRLRPL
jgi:hypothetical protein